MVGTVVITGPNGGMSRITARQYAANNPSDHLILLVRDPSTIPSGALPPSPTTLYEAFDMTSLAAVRAAAASISARVASGQLPPIKSVVCSATIQITGPNQPRITSDGYEETMAVNHLAHFALIVDLIPSMALNGQIIIVGSSGHSPDWKFFPKKAAYAPLRELLKAEPGSEPTSEARDNGYQRYGTSKLLQIMTGHELARRLESHPVYSHLRVVMFDPGSMGGTGLLREQSYITRTIIGFMLAYPTVMNYLDPSMGVSLKEDSAAMLCKIMEDRRYAEGEVQGPAKAHGGAPYYGPKGQAIESEGAANAPEKGRELWRDSAEVLGMSKEQALGG